MISDNQLEYNPQWYALANPGIGGPKPYVAPKVFTAVPATAANPFLAVTNQGVGYVDMMAATHRPLMPWFYANDVHYSFTFTVTVDGNHPTQSQVDESEASFCWKDAAGNSWYCNNSLQVNNEAGGMIQAFTPSNVWLNTGIVIPRFTPNVPCPVKIDYLVDTVNRLYSTLGITVNGIYHHLPAAFQGIPAQSRPGWAPGVYCQFQIGLASQGGALTNKYSQIAVNWL